MAKKWFDFMLITVLAVFLVACGNGNDTIGKKEPKEGVVEISSDEMELKFQNKDSFLLLSYVEDEDAIDRTNFIEAYDEALKENGLVGYFVNLKGKSEEELESLEEKYEHPESDQYGNGNWGTSFAELTLVDEGLAGLENGYDHGGNEWLKGKRDFLEEMDDIYEGIKDIQVYMNDRGIELD